MNASPSAALTVLALSILLVGAAYGLAGTIIGRRLGREALLALWPAASIALTTTAVLRVRAREAALGFPATRFAGWPFAILSFGVVVLMFGASTWVLHRELQRSSTGPISPASVFKAALACLGGFLIGMLVVLILDVAGVPFHAA